MASCSPIWEQVRSLREVDGSAQHPAARGERFGIAAKRRARHSAIPSRSAASAVDNRWSIWIVPVGVQTSVLGVSEPCGWAPLHCLFRGDAGRASERRARPCFADCRDTSNAGCASRVRRRLCLNRDQTKGFRAKRKSRFSDSGAACCS
jgi:hypothetical protein